eukprot:189069_1
MAASSIIFCTQCGTRNEFESNFCFKCGNKLQKKANKETSSISSNYNDDDDDDDYDDYDTKPKECQHNWKYVTGDGYNFSRCLRCKKETKKIPNQCKYGHKWGKRHYLHGDTYFQYCNDCEIRRNLKKRGDEYIDCRIAFKK